MYIYNVAYSLKARIVESQQLAVTWQQPVNNNRGMVFSMQSMPMAAHATMKYVMPSLSNNCTATEEQCFLCGQCQGYIMSLVESQSYAICVIHTLDKKPSLFVRDKPIFSSGRMLHKDYDRKSSVEKKISGHKSQVTWREDELIGSKLPVVK
jgi:hypothetical protein